MIQPESVRKAHSEKFYRVQLLKLKLLAVLFACVALRWLVQTF